MDKEKQLMLLSDLVYEEEGTPISTHVGPIFSSDTKDCYRLSGLC